MRDIRWLSVDDGLVKEQHESLFANLYYWNDLGGKIVGKRIKTHCQKPFANMLAHWGINKTLSNSNAIQECDVCHKRFKSIQSLTLHQYNAHGLKDPIRLYAPTTACIICHCEFWTRPRVVMQLKKSKTCHANLTYGNRFGPMLTDS